MRLYRHPGILRYVNFTHDQSTMYLFTEKASPLSVVQKQQSPLQVCLGLQRIIVALDFLHSVAHIVHNNVSLSAIFVTPEGNWKLAGMEKAAK